MRKQVSDLEKTKITFSKRRRFFFAGPSEMRMRETGLKLKGIGKKKFKPITTESDHEPPIAGRFFETENHAVQVQKPNQYWGGDITYIPTEEGSLYLAAILDLFTRKVVGYSMRPTLHGEIVLEALRIGILQQLPGSGLIAHSDRGNQYAAEGYRKLLVNNNIKASMSRSGNCYDNAFVESFFLTL